MPGLSVLKAEMARQYADARASFDAAATLAERIARRAANQGRIVLLGMGASHWVNRMVVGLYRHCGVNAVAEPLSDYLRALPPTGRRATLIVSQSGKSGEVTAYFDQVADLRDHFGLTLEGDSTLAHTVPSLVGCGGTERAYAATRSIMITLALHAAVLSRLGMDTAGFLDVLAGPSSLPGEADVVAASLLADKGMVFLSSRGTTHAVMEATALTYMELARTPAMALELGQFLHGPIECLSPASALVLARPATADAGSVTAFAKRAISFGVRPILFNLGEHPPVEGAVEIALPRLNGVAALARLLPATQTLAIDAAALRVADIGVPHRASKVTDGEAS